MRIGVIDIGTNSTRLLVADVHSGEISELERRSEVTRLGSGVDRHSKLDDDAIERVFGVLRQYCETIDQLGCDATTAVMTSAVRDSTNGEQFASQVRSQFVADAQVIDGDEEAQLTFLGATSEQTLTEPTAIIDIGGGSTEFVIGQGEEITFHTSLQTGVVRQTERHLNGVDPANERAVAELRQEISAEITSAIPAEVRSAVTAGIAVAGTATSAAAIDQQLEPYDPSKVHGYQLSKTAVESILVQLLPLKLGERQAVSGLHPDRALTIVAGMAILLEAIEAFGLDSVAVSEHDILRGAALRAAQKIHSNS